MQFLDWLNQLALQYTYIGVFFASLVGAMSVVLPVPYTFLILFLGMQGLNPVLLAFAGGIGSGIGEFSGYVLGYYGHAMISESRRRKMSYMVKFLDRYGPVAIFIFALTPLPDDLLFIPLGIMRYKFLKAFFPCLLGKLFMSFILAYGGRFYYDTLSIIFGETGWAGTIVTALLLTIILVAMMKIDWETLFKKYVGEKNGNT